ncbi:MAG: helix-turn-helix transcriptional regulator [Burkholderiales bacterium]
MHSINSDARLETLVNLVYDAALDDQLWNGLAPKIAEAFKSTSTVLKTHGTGDQVQLVEVTDNLIIEGKDKAWADHWHRNDLWVERSVAFGMSRIITSQDLASDAEFERSEFYHDWTRHLDIYHMVGAVFPVGQNTVGVLGIHRPRRGGAYIEADRQRVGRFLPHLNRALHVRDRLAHASLAQRTSLDALEQVDMGVIVVDADCRVLHTNRRGERILTTATNLRVRGGRLVLTDPKLGARLTRDVRDAAETAAGNPVVPSRALAINRAGRLPITMLVAPLRAGWSRTVTYNAAAMIFMRDPEDAPPQQDKLRELFDLTPTEAVITAALVGGQSLQQIAATLRVGLGTVRWHLKMILSKTGTHRQAQLVALVAHSVANVGSPKTPEQD